ncbi:MAG: hypothetical protein ACYTDY_20200, partial [Planctomycetota bacterium]
MRTPVILLALLFTAPAVLSARDADPKRDLVAIFMKVREGMKEVGLDEKGLAPRHDFIPADEWRLPLVEEYLAKPLRMTTATSEHLLWLDRSRGLAYELAGADSRLPGRAKSPGKSSVKLELPREHMAKVPPTARRWVGTLLVALSSAVSERTAALEKLSEAEWVHLRKYGSQFNTGMPTHLQAPLLRSHHARIDVPRIRRASLEVATVLDMLPAIAEKLEPTGPEFHLVHETEHGRIEIGGYGRNRYEKDCLLTIDLGGDDLYANSAGGTLYTPSKVSVSIDLAGNDVYRTEVGL